MHEDFKIHNNNKQKKRKEKKRSWVECVTNFLVVFGFIVCCFVWFNNTIYPNVYKPTGPEAVELEGSFRKESIYELISIIGSQDI